MVYRNSFVIAVKHDGKILRELREIVQIPFGAEYSILLKNLDARRCKVKMTIDDTDVLDNNSLIIDANSDMELKGFMKGNETTNRFKFIEKTKEISNHRGDKIDDGIIRAEVYFEKQNMNHLKWYDNSKGPITRRFNNDSNYPMYHYYGDIESHLPDNCNNYTYTANSNTYDIHIPESDDGITVKGNEVKQEFSSTYFGECVDKTVICIKLSGYKIGAEKLKLNKKPIYVQKRFPCDSCGKVLKSSHKFCSNCGTHI